MTAKAESYSNGKHEGDAESVMQDTKEMLEQGLDDARDAVNDMARKAQTEVRNATKQTKEFVKENPGVALLGAVGIGVLVGLAIKSR